MHQQLQFYPFIIPPPREKSAPEPIDNFIIVAEAQDDQDDEDQPSEDDAKDNEGNSVHT
jgi:hypothetical protein